MSMLQGGYDYTFEDKIHERFFCFICMKVMRDPQLMVCCGQKFCDSCLDCWCKKKNPPTCPHCRSVISGSYHHVQEKGMKSEIESFQVFCPHQGNGCKWIGELRALQKHLKHGEGCLYREVSCPHCRTVCIAKTYGAHMRTCKLLPVECPNECGKRGLLRRDLLSHMRECELRVVWCHRKSYGCNERVKFKEMKVHLERHCKLRPKSCNFCGLKTTVKHFQRHKKVCSKMPLECPNKCGSRIVRQTLNSHLKACEFRKVNCEYSAVGCIDKICHKDLAHHMMQYQASHLDMMTRAYDEVSKELEKCHVQIRKQQHTHWRNWFIWIFEFLIVIMSKQFFSWNFYVLLGLVYFIAEYFFPAEECEEDDYSTPSFWDYIMFVVVMFTGHIPVV